MGSFPWAASGSLAGRTENLAASDELRPSQWPGVSELTNTVDLPHHDGKTVNSELPLCTWPSARGWCSVL